MRSRFPHGGEVLGAAPANPILAPVLSQDRGLRMSRQRELLDLQAIQRIPGLVGYWKADPQYLFEDSAGTTPASTSGTGPIGQWLPVNAALTYGPELLIDPSFDNLAGNWTIADPATSSGGQFFGNGSTSNNPGVTSIALSTSEMYALEVVVSSYTSGSFYVRLGASSTAISLTGAGTLRVLSVGHGTGSYVSITTSSFVGTIDSISLKKVSGLVATQPTTANKPILRKTPTTGIYWADSNTAASALNVALGNLGSACTVARASAEGVTFTENVSITSTYNIAPIYSFNADVAIFNRALTDVEKALITRYMQRSVPMLGSNIANAINTSLSVWTAGGTNTKEFGTDGLTITYVDNTAWYTMLRSANSELTTNLTVGVYYLLKTRIKAVGSVSLRVQNGLGVALCLAVILPTEFEMRTIGFCAVNAGSSMVQFFNFSAGESATVGPITLVPVL